MRRNGACVGQGSFVSFIVYCFFAGFIGYVFFCASCALGDGRVFVCHAHWATVTCSCVLCSVVKVPFVLCSFVRTHVCFHRFVAMLACDLVLFFVHFYISDFCGFSIFVIIYRFSFGIRRHVSVLCFPRVLHMSFCLCVFFFFDDVPRLLSVDVQGHSVHEFHFRFCVNVHLGCGTIDWTSFVA